MPRTSAPLTPLEANRKLLNSVYEFRPSSKLYNIVIKKGGFRKKYFTLAEILTILKNYIRRDGLYDEENPTVIICSMELESSFGKKTLHLSEVRTLTLKHLIKVNRNSLLVNTDPDCKVGG